jgi:hypothetical protein
MSDVNMGPKVVLASLGRKLLFAIALIAIVLSAALYSIRNNRQLQMLGGMAEEYLTLGVNMYYSGRFYLSDSSQVPFVLRPPGYVKYLDWVLTSYEGMKPSDYEFHSQEEFDQLKAGILHAIYFSQCLLVVGASLILFFLLADFLNVLIAFAIALMFGINPYLIMLSGLVHYETLHIFMMLFSTWLTYLAFTRKRFTLVLLCLAGVFWALTTLVRPVTLIMPAFFAIMLPFYFRRDWKSSLLYFSLFTITFAGTIAPYTCRNYRLLHRFIPVNAQSNIAFWAGACTSLDIDANHYRWWKIWYPYGQQHYEKITGATEFQTATYADHIIEFEDFFKEDFHRNIASHPMTYAGNVCKNFLLLNFGINSVFIKLFQYKQHNSGDIDKEWLRIGNPQDFYPAGAANAFTVLMFIMSMMSLAGIYLAITNSDHLIYIPLMAFLTIAISHSITYMDLMYYYVRIPFMFIFTAFFIKHIGLVFKGSNGEWLQRIIAIGLVVSMFCLFVAVIG